MRESARQRNPENEAINNILKTVYPDAVKLVSPELEADATRLSSVLNQAKEALVKHGQNEWPRGTFSDAARVRFIRRVAETYEAADKETPLGAPKELIAHLNHFIETGELPPEEWEKEIAARRPPVEERIINTGAGSAPLDPSMYENYEETQQEQERLRQECRVIKQRIEKAFGLEIDLGTQKLEGKEILFDLKYIEETIQKIPENLRHWVWKTEIAFVPKHPEGTPMYDLLKSFPFGHPVAMNINMLHGFYTTLHDVYDLDRAVHMLERIKEKNPHGRMPDTGKASFWLDDFVKTFEKEYGIKLDMGNYEEDSEYKINALEGIRAAIAKLGNEDKTYLDMLKGTVISYNPKDMRDITRGIFGRFTIKYTWVGPPDSGAGDMEHRLRSIRSQPDYLAEVLRRKT